MRRTYKGKRGGFLQQLGNAVYSGVKQGIKNAPKQIYSSLKSSGSSYLTPTGSIANYAGNNIQNIIKSHNESFRRDMGNKMNTIRTTLKNKNKKPIGMKYPIMPYAFMGSQQKIKPNFTSRTGAIQRNGVAMNFKKYNSKMIYNNKYMPIMPVKNNKNTQLYNNKGLYINKNPENTAIIQKRNNKSATQLM
jgi:hypothetical protein